MRALHTYFQCVSCCCCFHSEALGWCAKAMVFATVISSISLCVTRCHVTTTCDVHLQAIASGIFHSVHLISFCCFHSKKLQSWYYYWYILLYTYRNRIRYCCWRCCYCIPFSCSILASLRFQFVLIDNSSWWSMCSWLLNLFIGSVWAEHPLKIDNSNGNLISSQRFTSNKLWNQINWNKEKNAEISANLLC